jgi:hypothetical protein
VTWVVLFFAPLLDEKPVDGAAVMDAEGEDLDDEETILEAISEMAKDCACAPAANAMLAMKEYLATIVTRCSSENIYIYI